MSGEKHQANLQLISSQIRLVVVFFFLLDVVMIPIFLLNLCKKNP